MPRPTKDYALIYTRDIARIDKKIAEQVELRCKLVMAYEMMTTDKTTFDTPPAWVDNWRPKAGSSHIPPAAGDGSGRKSRGASRPPPDTGKRKPNNHTNNSAR